MTIHDFPALPPWAIAVPVAIAVVGIALLLASWLLGRKAGRKAPARSTLAWMLPQLVAIAFLATYIGMGMVKSEVHQFAMSSAMITVAVIAVAARDWVLAFALGEPMLRRTGKEGPEDLDDADAEDVDDEPVPRRRSRARVTLHFLVTSIAILGVGFSSLMSMESCIQENPIAVLRTFPFLIELGLLCGLSLTIYLLSQRHGAPALLVPAVTLAFGVANYFVLQFKGSVLIPSDLMAIDTAAEVAGTYTYTIAHTVIRGIAWFCCAAAACSYLVPCRQRPLLGTRVLRRLGPCAGHAVTCTVMGLATLAILTCSVTLPSFRQDLGIKVFAWMPKWSYWEMGSLTCFVAEVQDIPIEKPDGYDKSEAASLLAAYAAKFDASEVVDEAGAKAAETTAPAAGETEARKAAEAQYAEQKPTIVFVMNETFADMSVFEDLQAKSGYEGPTYFKYGLTDTLAKGTLTCSVTGAGTCNTEFETLTGESMLYAGSGKYPYTMYDFSDVDTIARQLKAEGYSTTAMHPNAATNWHRSTVYPQMGFDRFLSIADFPAGSARYHNGLSDRATYDQILELLESDDGAQFIFDVTMQNHSSYDVGNIPAADQLHYETDGVEQSANDALNEYLACINASDEDLEYFVNRLRELDRPVILVFWGDHMPKMAVDYNDAWYADESDDMAHTQRLYETVYAVWANYDVAGSAQDGTEFATSPAYLAAMTLDYAGAPLSDYQKAQLVTRESMPAFNAFGLMGADGTWYDVDDEDSLVFALNNDMSKISYLAFATKVK